MVNKISGMQAMILGLLLLSLALSGCESGEASAQARYDDDGYWIVPILPTGPRVLKDEAHHIDTAPAVTAEITEVDIKNGGEVEVTFVVPDYEKEHVHIELTIAKWIEEENTWMNMLQRTRERGPQDDPMYGDGVKVIRGGNLRMQDDDALTGGEEVYGGMRFTTKLKAGPGDFGNVSGELQPIDFSDGVLWRRSGDDDPTTYGDPDDTEYHDYVRGFIEEINQYGDWEEGVYRVGVTERNRDQDYYVRFNAVADFKYDGQDSAELLSRDQRRHTAGEAIAEGTCFTCHSDDLRFPTNEVHGEQRQDPTVCANCHNDYTWDSRNAYAEVDGWPSMDMNVLTHKIHAGMEGYVADAYAYQQVRFPDWTFGRTSRPSDATPYPNSPGVANCTSCHAQTGGGDYAWQRENPDPDGCATCHGEGGVVFWEAEPDDPDYDYIQSTYDCGYNCSNCHGEDKPIEHTADYYHGLSERLEELATARSYEMEVVEVANAVAGESPRVTWRVHKDGEYQDLFSGRDGTYLFQGDPADFDDDAVRIGIGWGYNNSWVNDGIPPRKDTGAMGDPVQQVAHVDNTEPGGDETTAVTTFEQSLPEQARSGRDGFVILEMGPAEMDLNSRMANISLGSRSNTLDRDPGAKVDTESCLGCHNTIGRHGTYSDQDISSCISCHNAGSLSRDDSANQGTVDFMYIIHAIHGTGEKRAKFDRRRDHTVDGHYEGGYSYVTYPNTVLDCQACHTDDTHDFTEGYLDRMGVIGDKMKDRYLEGAGVNAPMASTCYSCHQDTEDDLADWELRFHLYHSGGDMYGNHDHAYYQENREKCLECHK